MSTDKHQILEPITAVARLITLAFKPENTKVAIRDHNIVLCEPKSDTYYGVTIPQSVDRYWNGDSREDIYVLNHVLCNFIDWYIIPYRNKDPDSEIYKGLLNMANYLRVGLKKLQNTYKSGTTVGTLQYYLIVLTAVVEGWFRPDMLYNPISTGRESFLDNDLLDGENLIYSTIFDVEKFKQFWSREELQSLCNQFEKCFKSMDEPDTVIFKDEEDNEFLDGSHICSVSGSNNNRDKDDIIKMSFDNDDDYDNDNQHNDDDMDLNNYTAYLTTTTTTTINTNNINNIKEDNRTKRNGKLCKNPHSGVYGSKPLPSPKSKSNVIVKSHLTGIYDILSLMDRRFTTMLSYSVKGTH